MPAGNGKPRSLERVGLLVGVVGGIVAVAVASVQSRAATVIVLVALVVCASLILSFRLWSRPRARYAALALSVVLLALVASAGSVPELRKFTARTVLGLKSVDNSVAIVDLKVATGADSYLLDVVVKNGTAEELYAGMIRLTVDYRVDTFGPFVNISGCHDGAWQYKISDRIQVTQSRDGRHGHGSGSATEADSSFVIPVDAENAGRCQQGVLRLGLPVDVRLAATSHTSIQIEVPKHFTSAVCTSPGGVDGCFLEGLNPRFASDDVPISDEFGGSTTYSVTVLVGPHSVPVSLSHHLVVKRRQDLVTPAPSAS